MSYNPIYDDIKKKNSINLGPKKIKEENTSYRMIDLIIEPERTIRTIKETHEEKLYETDGGRQKISCWLYEYPNGKRSFSILRIARTNKSGSLHGNEEITLYPEALEKLLCFILNRGLVDTSNFRSFSISYEEFKELSKNSDKINSLFSSLSKEDIKKVINNIEDVDYIARATNLRQKEISLKHLQDIINGNYKNEKDIEKFLYNNLWILGNEFSFFIGETKINEKNILDLFPKNHEGFVDIIELKTPQEKLFQYDNSHNNYYPSSVLTKSIAQLQNYLFELEKQTEDKEAENKYNCRIIKPKGIVICGSIEDLNEDEKKYLRILNSSYHNITVYTYQQIYSKANNLLNHLKNKALILLNRKNWHN